MNLKRTRFVLRGIGWMSTFGAVVTMGWAAFSPHEISQQGQPRTRKLDAAEVEAPEKALPSLQAWEKVWAKPLQRPLRELADGSQDGATKATAVQKTPPPNLVLVGTMVEDGCSKAMFSTAPGVLDLKGVGEALGTAPGGPEVVSIEPSKVVVRYQGELITLRLKGADEG